MGILIPVLLIGAGVGAAVALSGDDAAEGGQDKGDAQQGWSVWRDLSQQIKMDPDGQGGGRLVIAIGGFEPTPLRRIEITQAVVLYTDPQLYRCVGWRGTITMAQSTDAQRPEDVPTVRWEPLEYLCKPNGYDATHVTIGSDVYTPEHPAITVEPTPQVRGGIVTSWIRTAGNWLANGSATQRIRWTL